jgi:hypothetical protein
MALRPKEGPRPELWAGISLVIVALSLITEIAVVVLWLGAGR